MTTTDARVATIPLVTFMTCAVVLVVIGFAFGWLAHDAQALCAVDRTGEQVCVVPQAEGPNALEVTP